MKIPQTARLHELPKFWQEQVRKYRVENASLRQRLKHNGIPDTPAHAEFDELPMRWQAHIRDLRTSSAKYRRQRNDERAELAAVKAELAALKTLVSK